MISFKVSFNQDFLTSAGILVTSAKLLGSGMKCDTSETYSTKVGNELFNPLTTDLKTLCKPLPIILATSYASLHSIYE